MPSPKQEMITFKVDAALAEAMRGVQNRSEFIRGAILAALDGACPLCKGTGILSLEQREHWKGFLEDHSVRECESCHAVHLVCECDGHHERAARHRAPARARTAKAG
ncbi:MAG TPA: CopG family transcriptional regulator [Myxococcota bacterium]|nr:CopG family transcriptional regulator [Myxococcota bacterium]HRY97405.1 CopG family transcriptional regulator [Myxococcota bacterium]HSA23291.1 CopG family transcriptional regulator [Myxococcota bacterium]